MIVEIASLALPAVGRLAVTFGGDQSHGTGFFITENGRMVTCYHVIYPNGPAKNPDRIRVEWQGGIAEGQIKWTDREKDLAIISINTKTPSLRLGSWQDIQVGDDIAFVGFPIGVRVASVFSGVVSAKGKELLAGLPGEMIQVNGTVNRGNSGVPLLDLKNRRVVGVITAKYVPLFTEVEKLRQFTGSFPPQPPGQIAFAGIDWGKFVNFNLRALNMLCSVLVLVQVGIGYAVPADFVPSSA